ncbi:MAG: YIP1 family protein [Bacteroidales bacterium]|nr:YIP1 family protein [Bacteroidales bacterium]
MNLIDRLKNIMFTPKNEWEVIKEENMPTNDIVMRYLLPLALVPAIASFIGFGLIGRNLPIIGHVGSVSLGIRHAIISLANTFIGVYLTAFVIDMLAPQFGTTKNFQNALRLVIFSYSPVLAAGILYILPSLAPLVMFVSLYSLYILYVGLKPMMNPPDDKITVYFIISLVVLILVSIVVSAILGALFLRSASYFTGPM